MFGWLWRRRARRRQQLAEFLPRTLNRLLDGLTGTEREQRPEGRHHNPHAVIDCAVYQQGTRRPGQVHFGEAARQAERHRGAFVWLGLHEPDEPTMRAIADAFGLHELTIQRTLTGGHRPAAEPIGDVTRLVLRTARYVEHEKLTATSEVVDTGDVTVLVGPRFVITVRHGPAGALREVRRELEERPGLLTEGPWSVAYAICGRMIDLYLDVAAHVERDLERVEEDSFADERTSEISHIYQLKREMVEFKRAVLPLQEPLTRLLDGESLPDTLRPYFVDARGRLARAVERVAGADDLINSILQARLAQVSVDQNNDMRMIAAWAAIAAVPTVLAGIFGMNFAVMPGLDWRYGFYLSIGVMALGAVVLYLRFKKAGWL